MPDSALMTVTCITQGKTSNHIIQQIAINGNHRRIREARSIASEMLGAVV